MHIAARRALAGYSEALFEDVREFGTKVCVLNPGYVNTPMVRSDRLDRSKMIQPEDIARTVQTAPTSASCQFRKLLGRQPELP
jgi:NAD(P)-dependent dehydrogenase (short-subunit alcohol dehydrogenase family)